MIGGSFIASEHLDRALYRHDRGSGGLWGLCFHVRMGQHPLVHHANLALYPLPARLKSFYSIPEFLERRFNFALRPVLCYRDDHK